MVRWEVLRDDLLLLTAVVVLSLDGGGGCRGLPLGGTPPPVGLPPGPPLVGALPPGLVGSSPPDPVPRLSYPEGGSPGGVFGFVCRGFCSHRSVSAVCDALTKALEGGGNGIDGTRISPGGLPKKGGSAIAPSRTPPGY